MHGRNAGAKIGTALAGALLLATGGEAEAQAGERGGVSVAGTWELTMHNEDRSFTWNVTFEQDGEILSGFAESGGRILPLDGRLSGSTITFDVTIEGTHDDPLRFTGDVDVDGGSAAGIMDPAAGAYPEALMSWVAERTDPRIEAPPARRTRAAGRPSI